jgi:hypothetical protein
VPENLGDDDEFISNWLTDTYGYFHDGYCIEVIPTYVIIDERLLYGDSERESKEMTLGEIKKWLGEEYDKCETIEEVNELLNKEKDGMAGYVVKEAAIITKENLYERVTADYRHNSTELNGLYFDFPVRMTKKDILEIYAKLQWAINGDNVIRVENGKECDTLVPNTPEFEEVYEGNCEEFLESLNKDNRFRRYNGEERVDFVF